MKSQYDISFCIPTYNRNKALKRCIHEILKIKNLNYEIIVSDNSEDDSTKRIIEHLKIKNSNIKYFKNEKNIGQSKNIIRAINLASSDLVYITSDEDLIYLDFFDNLKRRFELKEISILVGSILDKRKSKKSFYIKHNNILMKKLNKISIRNIEKIFFRHYISGIILSKKVINFDKMDILLKDKDNLYAYIPALLMNYKGIISSTNEIICVIDQVLPQFTDYELNKIDLHYTNIQSRQRQFEFWFKTINYLVTDNAANFRLKKALILKLVRRSINNHQLFSFGQFKSFFRLYFLFFSYYILLLCFHSTKRVSKNVLKTILRNKLNPLK